MNFIERLKKGETFVCDGAMGTMLQEMGLELGHPPEVWNLERPKAVSGVHKAYIQAGADIIITNTFGANLIKLQRAGLEKKFKELNKAGAVLAKKAAKDKAYCFGDLGPTGELLEPLGNFSFEAVCDGYKKQAKILSQEGVDAIIIETMSDLNELKAAVSGARFTNLPIVACMTFQKSKKGYCTMMGVKLDDAIEEMINIEVDVIGSNCGLDSHGMLEIVPQIRRLAAAKGMPIVIQPNAGMPVLKDNKTIFPQTPADFAIGVRQLYAKGVNIIGGCCGTTPAHIKKIAEIIKK